MTITLNLTEVDFTILHIMLKEAVSQVEEFPDISSDEESIAGLAMIKHVKALFDSVAHQKGL